MRGKPLYPYAGIAIVGIALIILLSLVGVNQKDARIALEESGETAQEETMDSTTPVGLGEEIYQTSCIGCHGGNFDGPMASLMGLEERYTKEEIEKIISEGIDGTAMAAYDYETDELDALVDYLLEATK
ncbi:cytochrome c [Bacillaceae bacterium IKA-2]|nr:cytochrome c [Bacillaceae bacterium IKA-2]